MGKISLRINNYYRILALELLLKYKKSFYSTEHPGEKGYAREIFIKDFLIHHLPRRFGITTGHIIDSEENESNQLDIIIYDTLTTPNIFIEPGINVVPIDTVVGVIEVKSKLSIQKFNEAVKNLKSVTNLKRDDTIFTRYPTSGNVTGRPHIFRGLFAFELGVKRISSAINWYKNHLPDGFDAIIDEDHLHKLITIDWMTCLDSFFYVFNLKTKSFYTLESNIVKGLTLYLQDFLTHIPVLNWDPVQYFIFKIHDMDKIDKETEIDELSEKKVNELRILIKNLDKK